jgi:hypothetical protein
MVHGWTHGAKLGQEGLVTWVGNGQLIKKMGPVYSTLAALLGELTRQVRDFLSHKP